MYYPIPSHPLRKLFKRAHLPFALTSDRARACVSRTDASDEPGWTFPTRAKSFTFLFPCVRCSNFKVRVRLKRERESETNGSCRVCLISSFESACKARRTYSIGVGERDPGL